MVLGLKLANDKWLWLPYYIVDISEQIIYYIIIILYGYAVGWTLGPFSREYNFWGGKHIIVLPIFIFQKTRGKRL